MLKVLCSYKSVEEHLLQGHFFFSPSFQTYRPHIYLLPSLLESHLPFEVVTIHFLAHPFNNTMQITFSLIDFAHVPHTTFSCFSTSLLADDKLLKQHLIFLSKLPSVTCVSLSKCYIKTHIPQASDKLNQIEHFCPVLR